MIYFRYHQINNRQKCERAFHKADDMALGMFKSCFLRNKHLHSDNIDYGIRIKWWWNRDRFLYKNNIVISLETVSYLYVGKAAILLPQSNVARFESVATIKRQQDKTTTWVEQVKIVTKVKKFYSSFCRLLAVLW